MLLKQYITAFVLLLVCGYVAAEKQSDSDQLQTLLSGYEDFSADFRQVTLSENGRSAQETEGKLVLGKPNLFRWETGNPFPQEIVSDGEYIWIHDPDLEQVTRRDASQQINSAPAMILNGQIEQLEESYLISRIHREAELEVYSLQPTSDQAQFSEIRIAFAVGVVTELMLEDSLGQRTTIVFHNQQRNSGVDASEFLFRVPEGTDLIIDGEG